MLPGKKYLLWEFNVYDEKSGWSLISELELELKLYISGVELRLWISWFPLPHFCGRCRNPVYDYDYDWNWTRDSLQNCKRIGTEIRAYNKIGNYFLEHKYHQWHSQPKIGEQCIIWSASFEFAHLIYIYESNAFIFCSGVARVGVTRGGNCRAKNYPSKWPPCSRIASFIPSK